MIGQAIVVSWLTIIKKPCVVKAREHK